MGDDGIEYTFNDVYPSAAMELGDETAIYITTESPITLPSPELNYSTDNLNRISTATLNQKAVRPPRTGFILDKAKELLGYEPHSFEECLSIIQNQLK